jgi:hypothetical protein
MSVTLRRTRLSMPEKVLDHVERHASVHEETGERVAQVMQPYIGQTGAMPDAVPMGRTGTRMADR